MLNEKSTHISRYFVSIGLLTIGCCANFVASAAEYTCPPASSLTCVKNPQGTLDCTAQSNFPGGWQPISGSPQFTPDNTFSLSSTGFFKKPIDPRRQGIECLYSSRTSKYGNALMYSNATTQNFVTARGTWYDDGGAWFCWKDCSIKDK